MGEEMVQIRADCGTWMLWIAIELRFCASGSSLHHVNSRVGTLGLCSGSLDCFHLFSCHMWNLPSIFLQHPGILWYFCTMYNKFRHVCFTSQQSTHRRNRIGWQGTAGDCYLPTVSAWRLASGIIVSVRPSRRSPGVSLE